MLSSEEYNNNKKEPENIILAKWDYEDKSLRQKESEYRKLSGDWIRQVAGATQGRSLNSIPENIKKLNTGFR